MIKGIKGTPEISISNINIIGFHDIIPFHVAKVDSEVFQALLRKIPRYVNFGFRFSFMGGEFNKYGEMVANIGYNNSRGYRGYCYDTLRI